MNSNPTAEQVAKQLSQSMINALSTGYASTSSARCLGRRQTITALMTRGLIARDHRWTKLGREVAAIVFKGDVPSLDDLHARALAEQAEREMTEAAEWQATPAYRHFSRATLAGRGYRGALDLLHAEALADEAHRVAASIPADGRSAAPAPRRHPIFDGMPMPRADRLAAAFAAFNEQADSGGPGTSRGLIAAVEGASTITVTSAMVDEIYSRIDFVNHGDDGIAEGLAVALAMVGIAVQN